MDDGASLVDEVFVISDLHLGGEAPRQIFKEGAALAALIDHVTSGTSAPGRRVLVINGDFIDFLAEDPPAHFDPEGAVRKLRRIADDPTFRPVFAALKRLVKTPGRALGIVLGNHDVELALPWVRDTLSRLLCGDDAAAAGRIHWALDGQGLSWRLGDAEGAQVMCVHGNEVDGWNTIDHEDVRRLGRDWSRGQSVDEYRPNAGTRLVIEVMNAIKRDFPFVDLLKPETDAVIPTLMTLDARATRAIPKIAALAARKGVQQARVAAGWLSASQASTSSDTSTAMNAALPLSAEELLDRTEARFVDRTPARTVTPPERAHDTLGLFSAAVSTVFVGDKIEALRAYLDDLSRDRSFSTSERDDTFREMHRRVSSNIAFLCTGHTHLARAIEREHGRAYYFNTGTWARVVRIRAGVLDDPVRFRRLYGALVAGTLAALDESLDLEPVRPHVARFWRDAAGCHGELLQPDEDAPFSLRPVAGARYTRGPSA